MTAAPSGDGAAGALVATTIVSKNYLPFARVLARSFLEQHPEGRFVVLLVDRVDGAFDPADEPFELMLAEDLGIPEFTTFAFKYSILEINTAVKPFLLQRLFAEGAGKLLYLDPDILVVSPLTELLERLDEANIVLTPHLTSPIDDGRHPSEMSILQAGSFNLGFIGLAASPAADALLVWWGERMLEHCVVEIERGLFVDQKWIDLVPGLFEGVSVLRHPGYNVAYWNLHDRELSVPEPAPEGSEVNGEPLRFFHFSGFDPEKVGRVSKHQNRYLLSDRPELVPLFSHYGELLLAAGYREVRSWPYAFGVFDDGVSIPDVARSLYFSLGEERSRYPDPFGTGEGSFRDWAMAPAGKGSGVPYLSRLLHFLASSRDDLIAAFPDPKGKDLGRFADWLFEGGRQEYRLADLFLEPLAPLMATPPTPGAAAKSKARRTVRRANRSKLVTQAKLHLKRAIGEDRFEAVKRKVPGLGVPPDPTAGEVDPIASLAITRPGVNVAGYITTESGMGEGVRGIVSALESAAIPTALENLELGVASRMEDRSFSSFSSVHDFDVNLFFVNADQVPNVHQHLGRERFRRRYNVGFWLWELEEFPRRWWSSFDYLHEVWTPSTFCLDALSAVAPVPVRRVGLPIRFEPPEKVDRAAFELPSDRFVFLFIFDFLSYLERKNPLGLVRAFREAFAPDEPVELVLKTINSEWNPEGLVALEHEAADSRVRVLDSYMTKEEVHELMAASDAYVSLHRSEGFGLTVAEAMRLGKPVVATDYAGTTDFLDASNGFPVPFERVAIEDPEGPYDRGSLWAEPDLVAAARAMRQVYDDREEAARRGARARREIEERWSAEAIGRILRQRLDRIALRVNGHLPAGAAARAPSESDE